MRKSPVSPPSLAPWCEGVKDAQVDGSEKPPPKVPRNLRGDLRRLEIPRKSTTTCSLA